MSNVTGKIVFVLIFNLLLFLAALSLVLSAKSGIEYKECKIQVEAYKEEINRLQFD